MPRHTQLRGCKQKSKIYKGSKLNTKKIMRELQYKQSKQIKSKIMEDLLNEAMDKEIAGSERHLPCNDRCRRYEDTSREDTPECKEQGILEGLCRNRVDASSPPKRSIFSTISQLYRTTLNAYSERGRGSRGSFEKK